MPRTIFLSNSQSFSGRHIYAKYFTILVVDQFMYFTILVVGEFMVSILVVVAFMYFSILVS